jgi:hypothetical protein
MDQGHPSAFHGDSGLKFHPFDKANANADTLEIQFTPHDLCDENHERRVEDDAQTLLNSIDTTPL